MGLARYSVGYYVEVIYFRGLGVDRVLWLSLGFEVFFFFPRSDNILLMAQMWCIQHAISREIMCYIWHQSVKAFSMETCQPC